MIDMTPDRQTVINQLLAKPQTIHFAETELIKAQEATQKAQYTLDDREAELLQGTLIDGKNAEIRKAQLKDHTMTERAAVIGAVRKEALARAELAVAHNEFAALRAVSRLLAGEVA
jgi:DNA repair protein RadC